MTSSDLLRLGWRLTLLLLNGAAMVLLAIEIGWIK